jgi:hypothetical protein
MLLFRGSVALFRDCVLDAVKTVRIPGPDLAVLCVTQFLRDDLSLDRE